MNVDKDNFQAVLEEISQHLEESPRFIAIDTEFTGNGAGGEPDSYVDLASERLDKSCRLGEAYVSVQLGITICGRSIGGSCELRSYNILVAPESEFLLETSALKFLRKHKFDLNAWVDKGVRRMSQSCSKSGNMKWFGANEDDLLKLQRAARGTTYLCTASALRAERSAGFDLNSWVDTNQGHEDTARFFRPQMETQEAQTAEVGLLELWHKLRAVFSAGVPLVVHGLMDVIFLLTSFEQRRLPRDAHELARLASRCFPCVYDTCHLHDAMKDLRRLKLGLKDFSDAVRQRCERTAPTWFRLESLTESWYNANATYESSEGNSVHSAGYDSLLTAILFGDIESLSSNAAIGSAPNRFFLYRSIEFLDFSAALKGHQIESRVYEPLEILKVVNVSVEAEKELVLMVSEAAQVPVTRPVLYRRLDDEHLMLVLPGQQELRLVEARFPNFKWVSFEQWKDATRLENKSASAAAKQLQQGGSRPSWEEGRVKSIGPSYGFIECTSKDLQRDVFARQQDLKDLTVEQLVEFELTWDSKGPHAQQVRARRTRPFADAYAAIGSQDHVSAGCSKSSSSGSRSTVPPVMFTPAGFPVHPSLLCPFPQQVLPYPLLFLHATPMSTNPHELAALALQWSNFALTWRKLAHHEQVSGILSAQMLAIRMMQTQPNPRADKQLAAGTKTKRGAKVQSSQGTLEHHEKKHPLENSALVPTSVPRQVWEADTKLPSSPDGSDFGSQPAAPNDWE